jgi:hypothetical protein
MKAWSLASIAWLLLASPALAGGVESQTAPYEPLDAQPPIDACWVGIDLEDQSTSVESRRAAAVRVVNCLEGAILRVMEPMYEQEMFSRQEVRELLADSASPVGDFYFYLLARHRKCDCGTDGWVSSHVAEARHYESQLRTIVSIHNSYKY